MGKRKKEKEQLTLMAGESGTSTTGIVPFPIAEIDLRLIMFCTASSGIIGQFLGFTFRSGAIAGAGRKKVMLMFRQNKYNPQKKRKTKP